MEEVKAVRTQNAERHKRLVSSLLHCSVLLFFWASAYVSSWLLAFSIG
jgi:hypothetical protein